MVIRQSSGTYSEIQLIFKLKLQNVFMALFNTPHPCRAEGNIDSQFIRLSRTIYLESNINRYLDNTDRL